MTDAQALLSDLRALAKKWKHPGLTCEPWDDVSDDLRDLIAKHDAQRCDRCGVTGGSHGFVHVRHGNGGGSNAPCPNAPEPDVSEREELAEVIDAADSRWQHGIGSGGYDVSGQVLGIPAQALADAILAAGWSRR